MERLSHMSHSLNRFIEDITGAGWPFVWIVLALIPIVVVIGVKILKEPSAVDREYVPNPNHFESEKEYLAALNAWRRWSRERMMNQ